MIYFDLKQSPPNFVLVQLDVKLLNRKRVLEQTARFVWCPRFKNQNIELGQYYDYTR